MNEGPPLLLFGVFVGDEILPSYVGIIETMKIRILIKQPVCIYDGKLEVFFVAQLDYSNPRIPELVLQ